MKRSVAVETAGTDSRAETESLIGITISRMSDPETVSITSVSVTFEEVACQIKAAADPLTQ